MSFLSKKDVDAWDAEYSHVMWGGLSEYLWIQNNLPDNAFLLDAGCGTGRYLKHFFLKYPCVGIDLSKNAILRSIQDLNRAAEKKGGAIPDHFISNVASLPFKNECFDGILCLGVLQHLLLADRQKAAAEFYRVLKKGGCVYFEAFGESDMRCGGEPFVQKISGDFVPEISGDFVPESLEEQTFLSESEERTYLRQNGILYHYFKEDELKKLFEDNGFITKEFHTLKKEKKYDGKSYVRHHYRAVFEK
jgi:ubiquinone/menaquinone biosynthesis C-methylase UbiE